MPQVSAGDVRLVRLQEVLVSDMTDAIGLPSWRAHWISPVEAQPAAPDRPAYALTRRFATDRPTDRAILHITALGVYEAFLNGMRVGDHELAPGSTAYGRTLYAQSFDVTTLVGEGENELEVLLSDGWFRGRNGGMQHRDAWGDTTGLLAQLELESAGTTAYVVTDASWTSRVSHIVRADLMTGQTTDFSLPPESPVPVRVDAVAAPAPSRSPAPPVRRVRTLPPSATTSPAEDVTLVDFGQNISGWVRLTDLGRPSDFTEIVHGEHVDPGGDLTTDHLDIHSPAGDHIRCHQVDRVIAGPVDDVFEPRHTVHGFRYARIHHPGRSLDPASVSAVEVHTDLVATSSFRSSDPDIDRLHTMAAATFLANAVDVPTDCPTRERAAWTGDFQVFVPLAATMFDISGFSAKWLESLRDDQFDDGCLPMYAPDADRMAQTPDHPARHGGGSAGWGDAAVEVPWAIFRHYGDAKVLSDNWELMNRWLDFALNAAETTRHRSRQGAPESPHERYLWDGTFHFGEWLEPRPAGHADTDPASAYQALLAADQGEVATAYLYRSLRQVSRIATILGHHERSELLSSLADRVREAWGTEYLDLGTGHTSLDTQAGYVRALAFDLIPESCRDASVGRLVELIETAGDHLSTGFLSTGLLLSTLADHGRPDVAYRLLQQRTAPSWLAMLDRGATTYWENWEGVGPEGVVRPGSLNHYSKGAAMRFLYTHVLGIRQVPGAAGWTDVTIRPHVGGGLTSAAGHLDTVAGRIDVGWEVLEDSFLLTVVLPDATQGVVILPDGTHQTVGPGRHDLRAWSPHSHDSAHPSRSLSR